MANDMRELKMDDYLERRAYPRLDYEVYTKYKVLLDNVNQMHMDYLFAKTKNISKGGVCIKLPINVVIYSMVSMEMFFPIKEKEKLLKVIGEVRWCREINPNEYVAGLSFVVINAEDSEFLNTFIGQKIKENTTDNN